jgi:hypothetical protein
MSNGSCGSSSCFGRGTVDHRPEGAVVNPATVLEGNCSRHEFLGNCPPVSPVSARWVALKQESFTGCGVSTGSVLDSLLNTRSSNGPSSPWMDLNVEAPFVVRVNCSEVSE